MNTQQVVRRGLVVTRWANRQALAASNRRNYVTEQADPQLNGYPQLPNTSRQYLPPVGWQDNLLRKNFGDTLHEREELYSMWGPDIPPISPYTALGHFAIAAGSIITAGFFIKYILLPDAPVARREFPYGGLVKELGGLDENKARPLSDESD
ncbi:hypothetical protein CPB83DRAFT_870758 [Crepidotus variabilis]|uniref:NADH dehydrogenase [ubiquinone] 1 beta subcomplex subunit 8, mitochondrial n=1 Tax=Crepidotus variabilis TaxID=179855 RepID=A0A9P6JM98_9AGAR|nr:hypothetical protein CPB83DRAFT_870758 [Crepidotus variabilis]